MTMKNTLAIGSVSTGTLLMSDLIPAVLDVLRPLRLAREHRQAVARITRLLADMNDLPVTADEYFASDQSDEDYAKLCGIADCYCPPFCYFGSHEGDGADIGVWVSWDSIDTDVSEGGTITSDLSPSDLREFARQADRGVGRFTRVSAVLRDRWSKALLSDYFHYVNDHGNSTLYRRVGRRFIIVWELV
jgi:hypothetical protein